MACTCVHAVGSCARVSAVRGRARRAVCHPLRPSRARCARVHAPSAAAHPESFSIRLLGTGTTAAIACAYAAYKLGLKSHVFLSYNNHSDEKNQIYDTRQINTLHALNANITMCDSYSKAKNLEYELGYGDNWKTKDEYYVCPMGFNDDDKIMVNLLSKKINKAMKNTLLSETKNPRIWLVVASGGILMALHKCLEKDNYHLLN